MLIFYILGSSSIFIFNFFPITALWNFWKCDVIQQIKNCGLIQQIKQAHMVEIATVLFDPSHWSISILYQDMQLQIQVLIQSAPHNSTSFN